jgi:hypothetical protein
LATIYGVNSKLNYNILWPSQVLSDSQLLNRCIFALMSWI